MKSSSHQKTGTSLQVSLHAAAAAINLADSTGSSDGWEFSGRITNTSGALMSKQPPHSARVALLSAADV